MSRSPGRDARTPRRRAASPVAPAASRRWIFVTAAACVVGASLWIWMPRTPGSRPNILLVTIDTLRADRVGGYGYTAAETPALDALAARGVRFDQAQTAVPLTGPSHATILTGQYPPVHAVRDNATFTLGARHPTLATLLKARGYQTAAYVAAYPVAAAFGFSQGFEIFEEGFHESPAGTHGAERPGNEVADAVIARMSASTAAPFFIWAHFYDPHAPYVPPEPFGTRFREHPYDGEVAFTDAQLGRVLVALKTARLDQNTVVIVASDHGEGLGEHQELTHAVLIYQSTSRIPLIVAGPGIAANRVVRERVGTVDIAPTLLKLAGAEIPPMLPGRDLGPALGGGQLGTAPLYGESLFGRLNCRWASLRSWIRGDWKLIDGAVPELYNISDDPGEQRDRAAHEPERVRRMRDELRGVIARMTPGGDRARANPIAPEQEARLRSLGYASGSGGAGSPGSLDEPGLPDPRTHVQLYDRVQNYTLAQGAAIPAAIDQVSAIAAADPGNPFMHGALAALAYRGGSLTLAATAFARALELDPDRPGVRQNYGKLLRELGRLDESERQLRMAVLQTTEDDSRTQASLAETLVAQHRYDDAEALLRDLLASRPDDVAALGAKGQLLVAQGRADEAVSVLERTTATARDADPWIELGRVQLLRHDAAGAQRAAAEALRRSAGHPWALAIAGHAFVISGQRQEGLALLERSFATPPRRPAVWLSLADAFEAAHVPAKAAECRRAAAQLRWIP